MKVLLFSSDGCGSCKKWKPIFERLMKERKIKYEVIDIYKPDNKQKKEEYGITGIPDTIFLDDDGKEVGHVLGNMIEELAIKQIDYYLEKCKKQ